MTFFRPLLHSFEVLEEFKPVASELLAFVNQLLAVATQLFAVVM